MYEPGGSQNRKSLAAVVFGMVQARRRQTIRGKGNHLFQYFIFEILRLKHGNTSILKQENSFSGTNISVLSLRIESSLELKCNRTLLAANRFSNIPIPT
jgi:hypothetical protein